MSRLLAAATLLVVLLTAASGTTAEAKSKKKSKKPKTQRVYTVTADGTWDYASSYSVSPPPGLGDAPPGPATGRVDENLDWFLSGRMKLKRRGKGDELSRVVHTGLGTLTGALTAYRREETRSGWVKNHRENRWEQCSSQDLEVLQEGVPMTGAVGLTAYGGGRIAALRVVPVFAAPERTVRAFCEARPFDRPPVNRRFGGYYFGALEQITKVKLTCEGEGSWDDGFTQTCTAKLDSPGPNGGTSRQTWIFTITVKPA